MFVLLTRILLWALVATIIWYIFTRFIPRPYLTWLGGLIVFAFIILAFLDPGNSTVSSVWSILSFPLKPLGLSIFLLLSALRNGAQKPVGNLVLAGLLILIISSMPIVAFWLTGQTERSLLNTAALQQATSNAVSVRAVVVMGDGNNSADPLLRSRTQISNAETGLTNVLTSRLLYAAQVYQAQAPRSNNLLMVVSAGPRIGGQNEAGQAVATQGIQNVLVGAGVPGDRIVVETKGTDIYSSAVEIDRVLQAQGFNKATDSVILVAPAISINRTFATFRNVGVRVAPEPTERFVFQIENGGRLLATLADLVPNVDALALTTRVVEELLTSVYYFLRGWIGNQLIY